MAEGLFKKMIGARAGEFHVESAGTNTTEGFSASPETVEAMQAEGVDVSQHQSQRLKSSMIHAADKIFVMEKMHKDWILRFVPEAKHKVFLLTEFHPAAHDGLEDTDIPDPIRMSESFYHNVLSVIRDCVKKIVESV